MIEYWYIGKLSYLIDKKRSESEALAKVDGKEIGQMVLNDLGSEDWQLQEIGGDVIASRIPRVKKKQKSAKRS